MADLTKSRFSAATVEWPTPQRFFDALDREFGFTLDPCSTHENAKCERHFTRDEDGLKQNWAPHAVWMNPPYGRVMTEWIAKAIREARAGATVAALIPARTNTRWWHNLCMRAHEIRFVEGRPKFGDAKHGLPFPLAVLIFRPGEPERPVVGKFRCP